MRLLIAGLLCVFSATGLFAEHVFLKSGEIISGEITKETNKEVTIQDEDGKVHKIRTKDIMRTLFGEFSRQKVYIYKTDGSVIQAFAVDEDAENRFFRMDLESASEFSIPKRKIKTVSTVNLAKKKESTISAGYGYYAPVGSMSDNFSGNFLNFVGSYTTPYSFSTFRTELVLSAGYTGLAVDKAAIEDAGVFMIPVLVAVRYPFTVYQKGASFNQSDKLDVYVAMGVGINFVFLNNEVRNESERYMHLQPALGVNYKTGPLYLYIQQNFNYLDVNPDPFTSLQTVIGAGTYF